MHTMWRIELLGGLRALQGDLVLTNFETRRAASLLAYLALHPHRTHSREILAEMLWPEEEMEVTRDRFRQALSALRRTLESSESGKVAVLVSDRSEVGLRRSTLSTDVAEFEEALKAAERAQGPEERVHCLKQALAAYGGELLPGFYEEWIVPERERLAESYRQALCRLVKSLEASGDVSGAIEYAQRLVACDGLHEEAQGDLIRLYLQTGRRADAQRQYKELERLLREELGVLPSRKTRALLMPAKMETAVPLPLGEAALPYNSAPWSIPLSVLSSVPVSSSLSAPLSSSSGSTGGAMPLNSLYYIVRPTDAEFEAAISRGDSMVLVKGSHQAGKTSLLARGLQQARQAGAKVILTDLQKLTAAQMESADALFLTLAVALAEQLDLDVCIDSLWDTRRGWNVNFERFLRREVLNKLEAPLVWGLDEVDRLFGRSYQAEVFGLFCSWHNERSLNPDGPWGKLILAMAYGTEGSLFTTDLNPSLFNVGTRLLLEDFTPCEVAELNRRYYAPLKNGEEVDRFIRLVGGHPYLVQRGLHVMSARGLDMEALKAPAVQEEAFFGDHLHRMLAALCQNERLREAVRKVLRGEPCPADTFTRLRSAGVLSGTTAVKAQLRCGLYRCFLEQHLE